MSRRPLIAGNWKMHGTVAECRSFLQALSALPKEWARIDTAVFFPFTALFAVRGLAGDRVTIGAQNLYYEEKGAFTGEISPRMVREVADAVLIGHSERRELFHETDSMVARKIRAALAHELRPVVCVGETLAERDRGEAQAKIERQLDAALAGLTPAEAEKLALAYEPIWAIGTGRNASPEQAQEIHGVIRRWLAAGGFPSERMRILYGGSVKPDNSSLLLAQEDIDGLLVGGASLQADSFSAIIDAALDRLIP